MLPARYLGRGGALLPQHGETSELKYPFGFGHSGNDLAAPIIVTVLAYLHVIFAVGWMGGAILFLSVVTPGARTLSPGALLEFITKVVPRSTRYFAVVATATVIFGLGLAIALPGIFGTTLIYGMALGLVAYLFAIYTMSVFHKVETLARAHLKSGQMGPPPQELFSALKRGGTMVILTVSLLFLVIGFMILSGFPI